MARSVVAQSPKCQGEMDLVGELQGHTVRLMHPEIVCRTIEPRRDHSSRVAGSDRKIERGCTGQ
jgi:hypothetical protein